MQFGRNRDYETVCWEATHPYKLYNFRFTAIRSWESNPADSLFYQPMQTFGQHISITVTMYIYIKNCLNIKNLEKKIIYILTVALKFRKPEQNWAWIPENPKSPARPLSFRTSNSCNRDVKRCHIKILYMETTRLAVGAFLKTIASVLWKRYCRTIYFGLLYGTF